MEDFIKVSPLKVLERSSRKSLGPGNLGVLIARAGGGKTSCLIKIAFDKIFRKERLVHISLEDGPEKVSAYYDVMFKDLAKALSISDYDEYRKIIDADRMILAYLNNSFETERLRTNLKNLEDNLGFQPGALIVDGLDFENSERALFEDIRDIASEFEVEVWFSALSHRHITDVNERGIPYPCHRLDDLFSIIIQLQTGPSGTFLKLLKDHDNPTITDVGVGLDTNTFLVLT